MDELTKACSQCGQTKPLSAFYKAKECKYGVMAECKACSKVRTKADELRPKIVIEAKECSQCHEVKPAKDFGVKARALDGLTSECKVCHSIYHQEAKKRQKLERREKTCTTCHETKPVSEFYAADASLDGLISACKPCKNIGNAEWISAHPDARKAIANASAKKARENPEKRPLIYAKTRQWKIDNPAKVKEHSARDKERNFNKPERKEGRRKKRIKWFGAHPGYKRAAAHKRRALMKNATVVDAMIDIETLYKRDNGLCGLCGNKVNHKLRWPNLMCATIDHIVPLTKGGEHSWTNVVLAHHKCNSLKNNKTVTQQLRLF